METPLSVITFRVPLVDDVIDIFKKSHEFKGIQHDNTPDADDITSAQLWKPLLDSTVMRVNDCLVKKKSPLANKKKILTKCLEEILV